MPQQKHSKNSRCPCGSGKKYRKCCKAKEDALKKEICNLKDKQKKEQAFVEKYGHARMPLYLHMSDGRMCVVAGGDIYTQTDSPSNSFISFLHDHALHFFGSSFLAAEKSKSFESRHPAIQWLHAFLDYQNKDPRLKSGAKQIGYGAAWFRLAYDIFTLKDNARLEQIMRKRLLDPKNFQGARHELKVAALFIVAGFDVEFEDEQDNSGKHTEFIAKDKFSTIKVAVEVKSRHRRGVQGFRSGRDISPGEFVGVRDLVLDAYRKAKYYPNLPFYVFVDTNLPPVEEANVWNRWLAEIDQTMEDLKLEGYENPCPANGIFFTNDPSHYLGIEEIDNQRDSLWIKQHTPHVSAALHPNTPFAERIIKAHRQRLAPPAEFSEFCNQ